MLLTPHSPRAVAGAPNPFAPRKYGELQKISHRVYIYRNITNTSFIVGDTGVGVIDTQVNLPTARRVLEAIRSVTQKTILYVVNTHYHWDHTNGNALFKKEGATIVSSKLTKEFMTARAPRQKAFLASRGFDLGNDPLLPDETFEGEKFLDLGNCGMRLFFAGRAETDDATAVQVTGENVIASGDTVMTGSFPIFGQPVWDEGLEATGEWIRTLLNIMSQEPRLVLPGHGPVAREPEMKLLLDIERYFIEEVAALHGKGLDLAGVLADLEPRLPDWIRRIPIVWGTPRYAILRVWRSLVAKPSDPEAGWQKFKPSAIPAAEPAKVAAKLAEKGAIHPAPLEDYLATAREAREGGDPGLELEILREAAQKFSSSADASAAYADALIEASRREASVLEKGDFFEIARGLWDRALAMNPKHVGSLLGRGRYFVMMAFRGGDDPQKGMADLERAQSIKTNAEIEFYLGMGHRRTGDEAAAKAQFEKALLLDPAFGPARLALGAEG